MLASTHCPHMSNLHSTHSLVQTTYLPCPGELLPPARPGSRGSVQVRFSLDAKLEASASFVGRYTTVKGF